MKVAPVSADLLIKLALGIAVLGGVWYLVSKTTAGLQAALDRVTGFPGRIADDIGQLKDEAIAAAKAGGATWQAGYAPNADYSNEGRNYIPKYPNPLVNEQGYDFGQLSG